MLLGERDTHSSVIILSRAGIGLSAAALSLPCRSISHFVPFYLPQACLAQHSRLCSNQTSMNWRPTCLC